VSNVETPTEPSQFHTPVSIKILVPHHYRTRLLCQASQTLDKCHFTFVKAFAEYYTGKHFIGKEFFAKYFFGLSTKTLSIVEKRSAKKSTWQIKNHKKSQK
jgi:hypothetical protein